MIMGQKIGVLFEHAFEKYARQTRIFQLALIFFYERHFEGF